MAFTLALGGIQKSFAGVEVLDGVDLDTQGAFTGRREGNKR